MSRVLVKILLAPIILPMIIVMSLLSLIITIVASVYENVAGLVAATFKWLVCGIFDVLQQKSIVKTADIEKDFLADKSQN